jgi:hypothetical protein
VAERDDRVGAEVRVVHAGREHDLAVDLLGADRRDVGPFAGREVDGRVLDDDVLVVGVGVPLEQGVEREGVRVGHGEASGPEVGQ